MRRDNPRLLLGIVIVASVIARVVAAIYLGDNVVALPGTADQVSYHNLAVRLLTGHGFTFGTNWWPMTRAGEPTAHWSYLYTGFLALVYALFGVHPLAARLVQAILVGILHPVLAYVLARRIFNRQVAILAAAISAGYAYFVYYGATLMTEPFFIIGVLASLFLTVRLADKLDQGAPRAVWEAATLGLAIGATVLLRQVFLLVVPVLLVWLGWKRSNAIAPMGIILLVIAALIAPFTLYNQARFGQFVLLNTNSGYAFFWANHPIYGTHFISILPPEMGTYAGLIPEELRGLNEAALDRALLQRGLGFVIDDPLRYVLLSISRIPEYFKFWPSSASGMLSNVSRVVSFGVMWPFMLLGIARTIRDGLHLKSPASLMLGFAAAYTAIHLLSWALIRYRLPVDSVLIVFGAAALVAIWNWVRRRARPVQATT